jgi:hypothetical protein
MALQENQPTIEELGAELEEQGLVKYVEEQGRYIQVDDNCFEVAFYLADRFNLDGPSCYEGLTAAIRNDREKRAPWGPLAGVKPTPSETCFVIRQPGWISWDKPDIHVTLEINGQEYNFGAGDKEGFRRVTYLPLSQKEN